jgi:hypothetical protein
MTEQSETSPKKKLGRPKGSKNKPKVVFGGIVEHDGQTAIPQTGTELVAAIEAIQQFETSPKKKRGRPKGSKNAPGKKGRGQARESIELINVMRDIAEATWPITGRGIGYKLFVRQLIPDMTKASMAIVYRLLKHAREDGIIPWEWIVDETRGLERLAYWSDPKNFADTIEWRRDPWDQQKARVQLCSEKGTVRGLLMPVLRRLRVGFRPFHGFDSATEVHDIAIDNDGRPLILFYIGDYDPSGVSMTDQDLIKRLPAYGCHHVELRRIALTIEHCNAMPQMSFPASDKGPKPGKKGDSRHPWFVRNFGDRCWELDAMDPRELRTLVENAISAEIDWDKWNERLAIEAEESQSLKRVLNGWADTEAWGDAAI